MKRYLAFLPFVIAVLVSGFLIWGLNGERDPNAVPSALVGEDIPNFDLPAIPGVDSPGIKTTDLQKTGDIVLVNFFASWCVPCRAEHVSLTRLAKEEGLPLFGVNYKDKAENAAAWLNELGNPYVAIGHDFSGRAGLDWGLSGVPETYLIDRTGKIQHRFRGPLVGDTALRAFDRVLEKVREAAK